jgi:outer membrane protein TolC
MKPYTLVAGGLLRGFANLRDLLPRIAVCGVVAARVLAQSQVPNPVSLTLRDAVRLAVKQNPQQLIAAIRGAESERDRQSSRAALLPQAGISTSQVISSYNLQT